MSLGAQYEIPLRAESDRAVSISKAEQVKASAKKTMRRGLDDVILIAIQLFLLCSDGIFCCCFFTDAGKKAGKREKDREKERE